MKIIRSYLKLSPNIFNKIWQLSCFGVLLITLLLGNLATLAQNDMNPDSPRPPNLPSPSGFEEVSSSVSESLSSSSLSSSSLSSLSSLSSSQTFSSTLSSSILVSISSSQIILPANFEQDNTVRTGGFSTVLTLVALVAIIFGFQYHRYIQQNRGLKTTEKKLKK